MVECLDFGEICRGKLWKLGKHTGNWVVLEKELDEEMMGREI